MFLSVICLLFLFCCLTVFSCPFEPVVEVFPPLVLYGLLSSCSFNCGQFKYDSVYNMDKTYMGLSETMIIQEKMKPYEKAIVFTNIQYIQ